MCKLIWVILKQFNQISLTTSMEIKMPLKKGDTAPDFTLKNQKTENVTLSSFKGRNVVLLFFPFANTSVCTEEMCTMRDSYNQYEKLDAQVLAVSVDSPFTLKMWADHNKLNFPVLSDFNKEVSPKYDAFYEVFAPGKLDFKGVSKRAAFVIDGAGKIKYAEYCPTPGDQPNYSEIKKALE